jgi:hypothetical protein
MKHICSASLTFIVLVVLSTSLAASDSLADLPKRAIERSQITAVGSKPFVLKAKVVEITNLANTNYQAEIDEYWLAPNKWRRSVRTSNFSETLIVNGDKTSEQLTGDYYPNWLRTIVMAIFDPGERLQGVELARSSDNPVFGGTQVCRRFTYMAGVVPVSNKVFSSFCFNDGLIDWIGAPGYGVGYKNYKHFAGKQVARTITEGIESGTELEATVKELTELKSSDESQFAIQETNTPLQTIMTDEATLRRLGVNVPDIVWPTVRSGADKGTLSLYVCLDRAGHVREIYELNSSNPGLSDVARDQVMKWQFKPATNQGAAVQVESILTFAFQTAVADPIPVLNEEEGSKLIVKRVEPLWPADFAPRGTPIIVTIGVTENGDYKGLVFVTSDDTHRPLVMKQLARIEEPLKRTLEQWRFQPYTRDGKATEYQVKVTFRVN